MTETPDGDPNGQSREHDWPEPADAASREMCFQQGKACVYEPEDEPGVIMTEWPNGVVDRKYVRTGTRTRRWPDGQLETGPAEADWPFPHWPRSAGA